MGTSEEAKDFLGNLAADTDVKGMLYSAGDDIQEVRDAFEQRLNVGAKTKENMYKKFVRTPRQISSPHLLRSSIANCTPRSSN